MDAKMIAALLFSSEEMTVESPASSSSFTEQQQREDDVCPVRRRVVEQVFQWDSHKHGGEKKKVERTKPVQVPDAVRFDMDNSEQREAQMKKEPEQESSPPLTNSLVRQQVVSLLIPGAYSVHPTGGERLDPFGRNAINNSRQSEDSEDRNEELYYNSSLPKATAVDLDGYLQQAVPEEESLRLTGCLANSPKRRVALVCTSIMGVAFLVSAGLTLWHLAFRSKDSEAFAVSNSFGNGGIEMSSDPTSPPEEIDQYILTLLPEETTQKILKDAGKLILSPQTEAYSWLLEDPRVSDYSDARLIQRYVLATLYYATKGDAWVDNTNWLSYENHECDWSISGLSIPDVDLNKFFQYPETKYPCDSMRAEEDEEAFDAGVIRHIWLGANNLKGTIPDEVYMLTNLQSILLHANQIEGKISTKFGLLAGLNAFSVFANVSTGFEHDY
jgi:hypothetical protein